MSNNFFLTIYLLLYVIGAESYKYVPGAVNRHPVLHTFNYSGNNLGNDGDGGDGDDCDGDCDGDGDGGDDDDGDDGDDDGDGDDGDGDGDGDGDDNYDCNDEDHE